MWNVPKYMKIELFPYVSGRGAIVLEIKCVLNKVEFSTSRIIDADFLESNFDQTFNSLKSELKKMILEGKNRNPKDEVQGEVQRNGES